MPPFLRGPDRLQHHAGIALVLALGLVHAPSVTPAQATASANAGKCTGIARGEICIEGKNVKFSSRDDSWSFDNAELRDARGTRVTANTARGIERPGNLLEVDFDGNVHVEFRGAVLDADTARMVLRDEFLVSVEVKGSQATFSHQPATLKRRIQGRANAISYMAASGEVRFAGDPFWTNGAYQLNTPQGVLYNLNTGEVSAPESTGTITRSETAERVPPPRAPARSTAQ